MNTTASKSADPVLELLLKDLGVGDSAQAAGFDLRAYWQVVFKRKWGILSLTLVAAFLAMLYVSTLVPRYQAVATLLYDPPSTANYGTVSDIAAIDALNANLRNYRMFRAQETIMRSPAFVEAMVDRYELWSHPYFSRQENQAAQSAWWESLMDQYLPDWFPIQPIEAAMVDAAPVDGELLRQRYRNLAVATVRGGMTINLQEDIMLFRLGFISEDPRFAADMANNLAEYYGEYDLQQRMASFNKATDFMVERTEALRGSLQEAERAYQEYREQEEVGLVASDSAITSARLEEVIGNLNAANNRVDSISRTLARLDQQNIALSQTVDSSEFLNFPGVRSALEAELAANKELARLSQVYGPRHPVMIEETRRLEGIQASLQTEIMLVRAGLERDLATARADRDRLNETVAELREQARQFEEKNFQLDTLERAMDTERDFYNLFLTRYRELNIGSDLTSTSTRLLEAAAPPGAPFWPNKSRNVMLVAAAAFLFAIGLAFLLEYMDKTIKLPQEVEGKLGVPLLGSLAEISSDQKGESPNVEHYFLEKNRSAFAESIRTIRSGIMLSGLDNPYRVIVVTSTLPGEGKTTVSMNVAVALGQLQKVLLIDADMRRAALGGNVGVPRSAKGLADVAAGLATFEECVHQFEDGAIDVLPVGTIPPNPQELLSSDKFRHLLEEAATKYDRIIIDTAPAHLVSDPKLVARWSSAVIYVVRAERTPYQLALQEIRELQKINTPIIGVVLNGMSLERLRATYRYGYRRGYGYGGYGYGSYGYGGYGYGGYYGTYGAQGVTDDEVQAPASAAKPARFGLLARLLGRRGGRPNTTV